MDFSNPEVWVQIGLLLFFALLVVMKVPANLWKSLGDTGDAVRAELDEAVRIRQEAQVLLNQIKAERLEAEQKAKELVAFAESEAVRLAEEAKEKLAETIARRQALAERKIAQAEAKAEADVKAAAADLATKLTETILIERAAGLKSDPLVDKAIGQIGQRLS
ncbi:F0F1 ATP synthase subunit B family protein [Asticcacaulis machinosus]|uniref:ATP synthase subunit b n=1 Tax=Asticcacaulis machinosus TaxID=2984211 RepID=A0ABT5HFE8_9CAUL|nr:ATP F0F1 synthase subunit B [Asticcacaulis machinosus]MDC7674974.1 ATP F0F1 synthase subunit B [Asticcacaulis machinosus]